MLVIICLALSVSVFAQTDGRAAPPECPPGTHPVLVNDCNFENFHRPRYSCQRGFWFCFDCTGWQVVCAPNATVFRASINEKNIASVWVELVDNNVKFHFPAELKTRGNYTSSDLEKLSVDEPLELPFVTGKVRLVIGEYTTKEIDGEIVIIVPVQL